MNSNKSTWKSQKKAFEEALAYVKGRSAGKIKSFITPWSKVNDAGVDGLEWNSMIIIGGRPGTGKTLIKSQIVKEAFRLNPGINLRVLDFQFEMHGRASCVREFSSATGKSYKEICSAGGHKINEEDFKKCWDYAKERVTYPIDIVEDPCSIPEFEKTVINYMNSHSTISENGTKEYPHVFISIDHSYLFNVSGKEKSKTDMLYNLGEACTKLKRKYPIIFCVLSQLTPRAELPERNEDGKYGNYVLGNDIHGGDSLLQHADMVIGVNRPGYRNIKYYGPDKYLIEDDDVLVFHFLKCRAGDVRMSFFKAEFYKMEVSEMATPSTNQRKLSSI